MRQKKFITFIIFIYCLFSIIYSQSKEIKFKHITIDDGLSQSSCFSVVQDTKGFIWVGTEAGLNKYDGYNIRVYTPDAKNPASLSNNYIYTLCVDNSGRLWVGTDSGLNIYLTE